MTHYIALLRGVNVGAGNRIRMEDLRRLFEETGLLRRGNLYPERAMCSFLPI